MIRERPLDVTGEGSLAHPGPPGVENVTLELKLDSLDASVRQAADSIPPPDARQPQLRSQELQAEAAELSAESQKALLYPTIQLSARASIDYPNTVVLQTIEQNTFLVGVSMPLFEMDRTRHLAQEKMKEADAARYRREQIQSDLNRDFLKARELLESLREQQKVGIEDVAKSEESARLFYASYKGGRIR